MRAAVPFVCSLLIAGGPSVTETIRPHDNEVPAGKAEGGVHVVDLMVAPGMWYPEGTAGPGRAIYAFGEGGRGLSNPGPLLRVRVGTRFRVSVHNTIAQPLMVHGLHDRPGADQPLRIEPGERRTVEFTVSVPGTFTYWASSSDAPFRDRTAVESQLHGALVVDAAGARTDDRIFMIGIQAGPGATPRLRHLQTAVINGRSWPHTTRINAAVGDTLRMRWINASERAHPIHLHGFYFRVDAHGNGTADTIRSAAERRMAATELMPPGGTRQLVWSPERAGNWLMHCHMLEHVSPALRGPLKADGNHFNHTLDAMAGLVVGVHVKGPDRPLVVGRPARRIRLLVQEGRAETGKPRAMSYVVQTGAAPAADSTVIPGPLLTVTQNERVQVTVLNRMAEATSVHWHGIELESYFDGVSGFSGTPKRLTPHIAPNDSFVVSFTPPRAGTFIYHTHFEEERQLAAGLYGPLIVLKPGERYDPNRERLIMISSGNPLRPSTHLINGSPNAELDMTAGITYRVRIINISANAPLVVQLLQDKQPVQWRALAKDGMDLHPAQRITGAATVRVGVGETYDFEFTPATPGELTLEAMLDPTLGVRGRVRVR